MFSSFHHFISPRYSNLSSLSQGGKLSDPRHQTILSYPGYMDTCPILDILIHILHWIHVYLSYPGYIDTFPILDTWIPVHILDTWLPFLFQKHVLSWINGSCPILDTRIPVLSWIHGYPFYPGYTDTCSILDTWIFRLSWIHGYLSYPGFMDTCPILDTWIPVLSWIYRYFAYPGYKDATHILLLILLKLVSQGQMFNVQGYMFNELTHT